MVAVSNGGANPIFNISSSTPAPVRKTGVDDFLNSENDKNDYDWYVIPFLVSKHFDSIFFIMFSLAIVFFWQVSIV